jgi:hypothetical protein
MENGAGPLPIMMAGATSQSSTRAGSQNEDAALSTDAIIDKFIHENLADDLIKMKPADGLVADPEHNWVLAGVTEEATNPILIYSRSGASITLLKSLPSANYQGTWFDPTSGQKRNPVAISGKERTTISKPDSKGWLFLLRAAGP